MLVNFTLSLPSYKLKKLLPLIFFMGNMHLLSAQPIQSYTYILQADKEAPRKAVAIEKLNKATSDLIIIDSFFSSNDPWTKEDLQRIRTQNPKKKIVCYLSIGEAELYRPYWQKPWAQTPPSWLLAENPRWKGNFKVAYWNTAWQQIITTEVTRIMKQGFDGLFLDIVDGFEFFEQHDGKITDHRINNESKQSYRKDMVDFISLIAKTMRKNNKKALLIPQNGIQLWAEDGYAPLVSVQALEDLYSVGNAKQKKEHTTYILQFTKNHLQIPLLSTEYPTSKATIAHVQKQAAYYATILLVTDRELSSY